MKPSGCTTLGGHTAPFGYHFEGGYNVMGFVASVSLFRICILVLVSRDTLASGQISHDHQSTIALETVVVVVNMCSSGHPSCHTFGSSTHVRPSNTFERSEHRFTGQVELTLTLFKIKALIELSAMKIGALEFRRAKNSPLGSHLLCVIFSIIRIFCVMR